MRCLSLVPIAKRVGLETTADLRDVYQDCIAYRRLRETEAERAKAHGGVERPLRRRLTAG